MTKWTVSVSELAWRFILENVNLVEAGNDYVIFMADRNTVWLELQMLLNEAWVSFLLGPILFKQVSD